MGIFGNLTAYFMAHFKMTINTVMYYWSIFLGLLLISAAAGFRWALGGYNPSISPISAFGPLGFTVAILLIGMVSTAGPNWRPKPYARLALVIIEGLLGAQLVISCLVILSSSGVRFVLFPVLLMELLLSLSTGFIANMSVSGRWL